MPAEETAAMEENFHDSEILEGTSKVLVIRCPLREVSLTLPIGLQLFVSVKVCENRKNTKALRHRNDKIHPLFDLTVFLFFLFFF